MECFSLRVHVLDPNGFVVFAKILVERLFPGSVTQHAEQKEELTHWKSKRQCSLVLLKKNHSDELCLKDTMGSQWRKGRSVALIVDVDLWTYWFNQDSSLLVVLLLLFGFWPCVILPLPLLPSPGDKVTLMLAL